MKEKKIKELAEDFVAVISGQTFVDSKHFKEELYLFAIRYFETAESYGKTNLFIKIEDLASLPPPYQADPKNPIKHAYQNEGYVRAFDDLLNRIHI